jgi:GxxExxY protein
LAWELAQAGLSFAREIEQEIFYKELQEPIGTRRADFVVEGKVLVELKAIIELEDVHLAQIFKLFESIQIRSWSVNQFWK